MPQVEFRNVTKKYGAHVACRDVSLTLNHGHIHAVIGENGAGKSTLMKLLGGIDIVTSGEILIDQKPYHPSSARDAFRQKIAFIHQHFVLAGQLTALQNLELSATADRFSLKTTKTRTVREQAAALLTKFKWRLDLDSPVEKLSVGEQQRLEILKALLLKPDIIIFDEPTAVLTPQESDELLQFVIELKKENKTIVIITHKLHEVKKVADEITVLRQGQHIETRRNADMSIEQMAELMIGRLIKREVTTKAATSASLFTLAKTQIELQKGEIIGVAGIEGNGQSQLIADLLKKFQKNNLRYGDITEDRLKFSVFGDLSLADHLLLRHPKLFSEKNLINRKKLLQETLKILDQWDVRPRDPLKSLSEFSGGNQQKFVVGRELHHTPEAVLAAHPTRGVDLGAQDHIHQALTEISEQGKTVVLISSDLDEIMHLSDRFIVLNRHKIYGPFRRGELNEQRIGLLMASENSHDLQPYLAGDV